MSSAEIGWESLLRSDAPSACTLKGALLTTYDRAEERLLAEHLLPLLLKLDHEADGEGSERQYFLLELDARLKQLHDRITVVSSVLREEPVVPDGEAGAVYSWIWRSIRYLTVGSQGKAVQHAKLWLFHWGATESEENEYLEIVISSANLTRAAFRGQLQAAWRVCLKLHPHGSNARLAGWSVLPDFLRALAESTGNQAGLDAYVDLLARADCPDRTSFVASVPGTHSSRDLRRTPWGAAGLRSVAPPGRGTVGISILSPFVGSWNRAALSRWCANVEGATDRLNLIWIDKDHPWARSWVLPESAIRTFAQSGVALSHLRHVPDDPRHTDLFHNKHRAADPRWSHAKLYGLRRGNSRRLLLTSANFSPAAWGREGNNGDLVIENFELGVCIEQAVWPFDDLGPLDATRAATVTELPSRGSALIVWARAAWDGKTIVVECRCADAAKLKGSVLCGISRKAIAKWRLDADGLSRARLPWTDSDQPPVSVLLGCGQEEISVVIFDDRPLPERETSLPTGVDESVAQSLRDALLFEQYGGRAADDFDTSGNQATAIVSDDMRVDEVQGGDTGGNRDSYAVAAFTLARRHLGIVDSWAVRMGHAMAGEVQAFEQKIVRHDGGLLIDAFKRQAERDGLPVPANSIGANLAVEELTIRLKHFPEAL